MRIALNIFQSISISLPFKIVRFKLKFLSFYLAKTYEHARGDDKRIEEVKFTNHHLMEVNS